ncbi:YitT family protein [Streptomyces sp. NBC_00102]|uniref:YitT family protein n=1 Tax=Streptomyces sp. NBC_00102 TaxID=2975652 RepID=UPI00224ECE90|nr:YitT family protein [Streptomyces sp. NBC_00102]MCX5400488.1 YitT family protein [Streptomyces sp. NBC_00102]
MHQQSSLIRASDGAPPSAPAAPPSVLAAPPSAPAVAHTMAEDVIAMVIGTFITSFGLYLIHSVGAVTGGTAGLVLLLIQAVPWSFAAVFAAVNLPFAVLAWRRRGARFVLHSAASVALLSAFSAVQPKLIETSHLDPLYAVLLGNLSAGIGLLILFRHRASVGGFNVVALICQDRLGWRAGYVLMALDALVVTISGFTGPARTTLLSALGVVVLNLVVVMNHRPGRYPAAL